MVGNFLFFGEQFQLLGEYTCSDIEAMLNTVRLRFETHFDIYEKVLLLDSANPSCPGMKALKNYLSKTRSTIISVSSTTCDSKNFHYAK